MGEIAWAKRVRSAQFVALDFAVMPSQRERAAYGPELSAPRRVP